MGIRLSLSLLPTFSVFFEALSLLYDGQPALLPQQQSSQGFTLSITSIKSRS